MEDGLKEYELVSIQNFEAEVVSDPLVRALSTPTCRGQLFIEAFPA